MEATSIMSIEKSKKIAALLYRLRQRLMSANSKSFTLAPHER
jgi:hypothetical protein